MSGHPWLKFYPSDWRADIALRVCSIAARGLYFEMALFNSSEGLSRSEVVSACQIEPVDFDQYITELIDVGLVKKRKNNLFLVPSQRYLRHGVCRSVTHQMKQEVYERDGAVCRYCGDECGPFEVDHIHPVSRGGVCELKNLTVACKSCNRSKGNKTLDEWGGA